MSTNLFWLKLHVVTQFRQKTFLHLADLLFYICLRDFYFIFILFCASAQGQPLKHQNHLTAPAE